MILHTFRNILVKKLFGNDLLHRFAKYFITFPYYVYSHAVQSSNGNFIILHPSSDNRVDLNDLISEVSIDGTKIIRSFDPRSIESNELKNWSPCHLSIDEDDNIAIRR